MTAITFEAALLRCPLIAILRGVRPEEVLEIGEALHAEGFAIVEVPLNSPDPLHSIRLLSQSLGGRMLVGAGTVLDVAQVDAVTDAGGRLIVLPHADGDIVRRAKQRGAIALPGFATPTEAFAMLAAGADGLKLFPAEASPPAVLKALRAVLPHNVPVFPVGSITSENMAPYLDVGARGFGLGSALFKPGMSAAQVGAAARRFIDAWRGVTSI